MDRNIDRLVAYGLQKHLIEASDAIWARNALLALLEAGLLAMWYALWLELQADTRRLNDSLRRFQAK